ncbi:MAG: hypothetical protein VYA99_05275 [Pseudomonadota bacterium]|nr:hypothetical protein [Pseudomonadota bacterium]
MNVNGAGIVMGRQILIRFCRLVLPVTIVISLCLTWNCLDRNLMVCLPKSCFARLLGKFHGFTNYAHHFSLMEFGLGLPA